MSDKEDNCPFCGANSKAHKTARSLPQLRRYHKLITAAFDNWPEKHDHQFTSLHEFRKWVEMKAGARVVGAQIPLSGMSKERALMLAEAAIRGAGSYAWPVLHGDTLVVFRPKSISFARMPHMEFCKLSDCVAAVIWTETGIDPEQLLRENEGAA